MRPALIVYRTVLAAFLVAALGAQSYGPADLDEAFEPDTIVISASEHFCFRFDVWLARTREQQRRGLMFVRDLPITSGMLFVYDGPPTTHSIWMKNTYIPLDIVFIRDDGIISSIFRDAEPLTLNSRRSSEPVSFTLELNGGVTEALGINVGDQFFWSGTR